MNLGIRKFVEQKLLGEASESEKHEYHRNSILRHLATHGPSSEDEIHKAYVHRAPSEMSSGTNPYRTERHINQLIHTGHVAKVTGLSQDTTAQHGGPFYHLTAKGHQDYGHLKNT
jgi:hypothetical protein